MWYNVVVIVFVIYDELRGGKLNQKYFSLFNKNDGENCVNC